MNILFAVVKDIVLFVRDSFIDILPKRDDSTPSLPPYIPSAQLTSGRTEEETLDDEEPTPTFRSAAEILDANQRPQKNTILYVGEHDVPLYQNPTVEFDGVIAVVPYGAMVMALEQTGRWVRVSYKHHVGWGIRDRFFDRAGYVYPEFVIGEPNDADSIATLRTRACIHNEFHGDEALSPLMSEEYVLYKLYRKGVDRVPWPNVRPRTPGTWHDILRGRKGVHITVDPKDASIMEYIRENGEGHLAFVEAVFPDETISLSEVNYPNSGAYNERVLTKDEWKELRPVFMSID